jgi:hypothetical protein
MRVAELLALSVGQRVLWSAPEVDGVVAGRDGDLVHIRLSDGVDIDVDANDEDGAEIAGCLERADGPAAEAPPESPPPPAKQPREPAPAEVAPAPLPEPPAGRSWAWVVPVAVTALAIALMVLVVRMAEQAGGK